MHTRYFELNSLVLKCWKKATEELPELMTGGGFFYVFLIFMATLFLLKDVLSFFICMPFLIRIWSGFVKLIL